METCPGCGRDTFLKSGRCSATAEEPQNGQYQRGTENRRTGTTDRARSQVQCWCKMNLFIITITITWLLLSSSCKFPFNFTPLRFTYHHHHCSSLSNNQITKIGLMESDDYYDRIILSYCCTFTLWMNQLWVWLCLVTVKCLLRFDFLF